MQSTVTSDIVAWLATPVAYTHPPLRVEHVETHISHVFLTEKDVYKLKKPVRFDFLDFSTLAAREQACREELRLNRRLAPGVYLDVLPVTRAAEQALSIGGSGEVLDWLVHMRRLPADLTLDVLHAQGQLRPEQVERLAETLVSFYESQPSLPIAAEAYRERFMQHIQANLRELLEVQHHLPQAAIRRAHAFQLQRLALSPELFDERVRRGRIVDGHGDLRPEHICLTAPVAIFDCIEFNAEFRQNDVADELAFLAEECAAIGADWAGRQLLESYQRRTDDHPEPVLWDFYQAYRACVRAKVAALRSEQKSHAEQQAAWEEARQRLNLADRYAASWLRPVVLAVGGTAGTGKTTLAHALAARLGSELLRSDVVRNELFSATDERYSEPARRRVYEELMERGRALVGHRISVVLDATFSMAEMLDQASQMATSGGGDFLAIECVCRPEVARERIAKRLAAGRDASEARPEIHDAQREAWQSWPTEIPQVRVDTEQPMEQQLAAIIEALRIRS
jgi:aminoglycoside phosphotransferase family enzyme/thymidylate kinase